MNNPKHFFEGKNWFVIGDFNAFSREKSIEIIQSNGGTVVDDILKATHVLAPDEVITGAVPNKDLKKIENNDEIFIMMEMEFVEIIQMLEQ